MNSQVKSPLAGPPPSEVPLLRAPLVRVIAQVKFPLLLAIRNPDSMAPFQEAVREAYPHLQPEQTFSVVMGQSNSPPDVRAEVVWRFRDASGDWILSVAPEFLALETTRYTNRKDFVGRFRAALSQLVQIFRPQQATRLGLRYVDRIEGASMDRIHELIDDKVLGLQRAPIEDAMESSITQVALKATEGMLHARWGLIPAHGTPDPAMLPAIDSRSWILDLDLFTQNPMNFEADGLADLTRSFAERIYAVFRWMVTDEFLRTYGGKP